MINKFKKTSLYKKIVKKINKYCFTYPKLNSYGKIKYLNYDLEDWKSNKDGIKNGLGYSDIILKWDFNYVYDVGCNKGLFLLWLCNNIKNKISGMAVDASDTAIKKCLSNLKLNSATDNVYVLKGLVGYSGGKFIENSHSPESKIVYGSELGEEKIRISDAWATFMSTPCDLLKIDIEGAEYDLLSDPLEAYFLSKCKYIVIEYHKPIVNLSWIRDKFTSHRLLKFEEYENVGYAYFQLK